MADDVLLREERYEIRLDEVSLSRGERRGLLDVHRRIDHTWHDLRDGGSVRVDLPEPVCAECGEPWGKMGCRVARAVLLAGILERETARQERQVSELREALAPRFGYHRLRDPGNSRVELRWYIDEYTLIHGRMGLVDFVLTKVRREFEVWLKNVGDLARIRADHLYALSLDSQRYAFLTQEFNPSAALIKAPDAPWDNIAQAPSAAPPSTPQKDHP